MAIWPVDKRIGAATHDGACSQNALMDPERFELLGSELVEGINNWKNKSSRL
jgi:hypothetical protein